MLHLDSLEPNHLSDLSNNTITCYATATIADIAAELSTKPVTT